MLDALHQVTERHMASKAEEAVHAGQTYRILYAVIVQGLGAPQVSSTISVLTSILSEVKISVLQGMAGIRKHPTDHTSLPPLSKRQASRPQDANASKVGVKAPQGVGCHPAAARKPAAMSATPLQQTSAVNPKQPAAKALAVVSGLKSGTAAVQQSAATQAHIAFMKAAGLTATAVQRTPATAQAATTLHAARKRLTIARPPAADTPSAVLKPAVVSKPSAADTFLAADQPAVNPAVKSGGCSNGVLYQVGQGPPAAGVRASPAVLCSRLLCACHAMLA